MNKVLLALAVVALLYQMSSAAPGDTVNNVTGAVNLIQPLGTTMADAGGEIIVIIGSYSVKIFPTDPGASVEYDLLLNARLMTIRGYAITVTFNYVKADSHLLSCWY
jgi:hypothetical protein